MSSETPQDNGGELHLRPEDVQKLDALRSAEGNLHHVWRVTDPLEAIAGDTKDFRGVKVSNGPDWAAIAYNNRGEVLTLTGPKTPENLKRVLALTSRAHQAVVEATRS